MLFVDLVKALLLCLIVDNMRSVIINTTIIIKETIKIYEIEFSKTVHSKVIAPDDIKAPNVIAIKQQCMFRFVSPAIKLPVHTPVRGIGTATKAVKARYFLKFEDFPSMF